MKPTGITRPLDPLGRIVIPMEIRKTHSILPKTPMEIFIEDDKIILQKYEIQNACIMTGDVSRQNMSLRNGALVLSPQGADQLAAELETFLKKSHA